MTILRGAVRVIAALSGLLLVYGTVYALEGMASRIPVAAAQEFAVTSLWMAPWMLLFCSGLEDIAVVTRKELVFWLGVFAALLFLYYFDWHTSLSALTKAAMPPVSVGAGLAPHFIRRIKFLFVLSSGAAGVAGLFVLYYVAETILTPTSHFATWIIGLVIVTFVIASIVTGLLAAFDVSRKMIRRLTA